jgi:nicotinamidase-related amidase
MKKSKFELPLPSFFNPAEEDQPRRVLYGGRNVYVPDAPKGLLDFAVEYRSQFSLAPRAKDDYIITALGIDYQDTFMNKLAELVVRGGTADSGRFATLLLRYIKLISDVWLSLDSHFRGKHIFHPYAWVNDKGEHPPALTCITHDDVLQGKWKPNPAFAFLVGKSLAWLEDYVAHYTAELAKKRTFKIRGQTRERNKPPLIIWPFHSPIGGIGHALHPKIDEAATFLEFARGARLNMMVKGSDPLTECYSIFGSEVVKAHDGTPVGRDSEQTIKMLLKSHVIIIGGEAESHCDAESIYDLLIRILAIDPALAEKVYLLEDCMSPVPGFEQLGVQAKADFQDAGMHLVRSTTPIEEWPGIDVAALEKKFAAVA